MQTVSTRTLYLLNADDEVDESILRRWVADHGGAPEDAPPCRILVPRTRPVALDALARRLAGADDLLLSPLRVAWLPEERDGERTVRVRDLVQGDPAEPDAAPQATDPEPSTRTAPSWSSPRAHSCPSVRMRQGAPDDGDARDLATFVARQALLALERAEYRVRGARYKVPRLVREELMASAAFRRRRRPSGRRARARS